MHSNLQHMYQAWLQGNENYVREWANFVDWAARFNGTTFDIVFQELQKCNWFERPIE